jgi:hypothetical protein
MSTEQALHTIVRVVGPYVGETMARSAAAAHCQKLGIGGEVGGEQLETLIGRLGSGLNIFLGRDKSARVVAELRQALKAGGTS